jgi:hypothetical protein
VAGKNTPDVRLAGGLGDGEVTLATAAIPPFDPARFPMTRRRRPEVRIFTTSGEQKLGRFSGIYERADG